MSAQSVEPVHRVAARVVLLDSEDRVLLFRGIDPAHPEQAFWMTPGGGLEPGESIEDGARRELAEETGCRHAVLGPPLWTRVAEFSFDGVSYHQSETFLLARVPSVTSASSETSEPSVSSWSVDTAGFTDLERRSIQEHRWWRIGALADTPDVVYPTSLAGLLRALLRDGPPARPFPVEA